MRPGVEDFDGQRGYLVLPGLLDPVNQIIRRIELEFAQYLLTELRPCAFAVVIINHGLQRAQPDFKTAAFVAENMAPAAHFGGLAVPGAGEATRAGAAQHEHPDGNGARRAPFPSTLIDRRGRDVGGHERRFQIVRRITRNARPDFGSGAANSFAVGFRARAGHADGNRGRRGRRIGDCMKLTDQLRVAQEAKIGWSESARKRAGSHSAITTVVWLPPHSIPRNRGSTVAFRLLFIRRSIFGPDFFARPMGATPRRRRAALKADVSA